MSDVGLARGTVRLEPHNSEWDKLFEKEAEALRQVLSNQAKDIQHVGSTAIPGLHAKPIIDIAILVDNLAVAEEWVAPLAEIDYWNKGAEPNMPDRRFFAKGADNNRTVYLHVVNEAEFSRLTKFKKELLNDSNLVKEYGDLKQSLAEAHADNRETYTKAKNDFIQEVLSR